MKAKAVGLAVKCQSSIGRHDEIRSHFLQPVSEQAIAYWDARLLGLKEDQVNGDRN